MDGIDLAASRGSSGRFMPAPASATAGVSLHSACISPSSADMRNVVATLPRAERRRIAAMVRQRRPTTFAAARQG